MADLRHFSSKSELSASENLAEFIRMCRDALTVFGVDLCWNDTSWPKAANFTKLGVPSEGFQASDRLDDAFIDFAKAYFRYQQGHHPTVTKNESKALRVIEAALLKTMGGAKLAGLDFAILDEAVVLAMGHYSPMAAYHCGRELQRLALFVSEKHLIPSDLSTWKSPIKKPPDITIQTGAKAKAIQEKKMPSQEALNALAEIFANDPTGPKDIFTTSTFAMTMCAPMRISEILDLPADCEVEEKDSKGVVQYGWRFYSAKGYEGDIKWIPEIMVPVAKKALSRIRMLTESSRKLAEWVENCPGKPYRHTECPDVADDELLTVFQACAFLGLARDSRRFCTGSLRGAKLEAKDGVHTLNSLWKYVLARQPKGFPWLNQEKKIKYSNALFCMSRNLIGDQRGTSPVILWAPTSNVFNNNLSPRESLQGSNHQSIFDRHGYKASNGSSLKLTSHQSRHLLNTLANRGGLTQEQLAKWAGRADPKQNRVYNHMSEWEMVAKAEALDTSLTLFGPKGEVSLHVPVSTQEINLMERGAVHVSLWGVCSHDFIMSPCEKFRDCLNCEEHVCIKGQGKDNVERLVRIKMRLSQVEKDYTEAQEAVNNGYSGADRWYEYHQKTVEQLRQLIEILESPQIPEGAQIKLRDGKDFNHLRRVIRAKAMEAVEGKMPDATLLSEMSRLLDGRHG
ncbi:integrase [Aquitalea magnusonii]|uniref:Integrase n=2 Tax=Aquitalea aquatica TaxID=3044273 RepID=A0A838Y1C1_9NEIS|nr:integrase [Aquitalea magnusonii]